MSAEKPRPLNLEVELPALLESFIAEHDGLLTIAESHRAAIRRADPDGVRVCNEQRARAALRLQELSARHRALLAARGRALDPKPPGISALATTLPEPARARALDLIGRLRLLVARVQEEHRVIKIATDSLLAHVDGVMSQVARRISQTGAYSHRGFVAAGPPIFSGIDIRH